VLPSIPYIDFDKGRCPRVRRAITIWENVRIEESLRSAVMNFGGGTDGAIVLARTGGVNHMQVYYAAGSA